MCWSCSLAMANVRLVAGVMYTAAEGGLEATGNYHYLVYAGSIRISSDAKCLKVSMWCA